MPKQTESKDIESFVKSGPKKSSLVQRKMGRPKSVDYETEVAVTVRMPKAMHKNLKQAALDQETTVLKLILDKLAESYM